jgi:putative membrane protein
MSVFGKGGVILTGAALVLLSGGAAIAQKSDATKSTTTTKETTTSSSKQTTSNADQKFVKDAASGGMAEVQLGKLATEKASNAQVKQFGQRMVDDHSKANDELKSVASKDNITLPSDLSPKDKATYDSLSKLSGTAFDRAYMRDMVKDHQTDVNEFQKEANSGSNPDLKSFAGSTLPTLQDHLRMARETNNALGSQSRR